MLIELVGLEYFRLVQLVPAADAQDQINFAL